MPKLQNVSLAEIKTLNDAGEDMCMELYGLNQRIEKGYCDEIGSTQLARSFLNLSRAAADMAANILVKVSLQEMQRETEAVVRTHQSAKG